MAYILDTNIFIRSKNEMPFDLWPSFWTKIKKLIDSGKIFSCEMVKTEIDKGKDDLTDWLHSYAPSSFYIPVDAEVMVQYAATQTWAASNLTFSLKAKQEYAVNADAYLVATAKAKGLTLVSYETPDPNCRKRVKIPDACAALQVNFCDLNTMMKELGITI